MNNNIKKLYEDASLVDVPGGSRYSLPDEFVAKFAESLVKECGVALSPMLRDMISRGQAYDLIKQHFGVEG
jgi:hypothetical protein